MPSMFRSGAALEAGLSEVKRQLLERYLSGEAEDRERRKGTSIRRRARDTAPLSFAQEELLYRELTSGTQPLYNEAITVRRRGVLNASALERSLTEIVRRHEIWRTKYQIRNGSMAQVIHPAPKCFPLDTVDLRGLGKDKAEAEIERFMARETARRFDLGEGPLTRATLLRLDGEQWRLFLVAHLSIIDGVSVYQVFPTELAALYSAFDAGKPSTLADPVIQYADYAYWQRETLPAEKWPEQLAYWRRQFEGDLPVSRWPAVRAQRASASYQGEIFKFVLQPGVGEALKDLGRQKGFTFFTTLLACFSILLHSMTSEDQVTIGTPAPAGRKQVETQGLLGHFLNPIVLRINVGGNPTLSELLCRVHEVLATGLCYDDLPLNILMNHLQRCSNGGRNPLFTAAMSLQPKTPQTAGEWEVTSMDANSGGSPWDFYLAFIEAREGIIGRVQYDPKMFEAATITETVMQFQNLLGVVANHSEERISYIADHLRSLV